METLNFKMNKLGFSEPEMDHEPGSWPNPDYISPGRVEVVDADTPMVLEANGTAPRNPFDSQEVILSEPVQYDPLDVVAPWVLPPGAFNNDLPIQKSALDGSTSISFDNITPSTSLQDSMTRIQSFLQRYPPSLTPQSHGADWITFDLRSPSRALQLERSQNVEALKAGFANIVSQAVPQGEFRPERNAHPQINPSSLDALAREHGVLSGKWLIFTDATRVDNFWGKVVSLVCAFNGVQDDSTSGDASLQFVYARVSTRKMKMQRVTKRRFGNHSQDTRAQGEEVIEEQPHVISLHTPNYLHQDPDTTVATPYPPEHVAYLREALRELCGVKWKIGFKPDAYTHLGIYRGNEWGVDVCRWLL
jgi:Domain of unknown function (DUF1917)